MRKVSTYKMAFTLLAATSLLAGCSGDDFNGNGNVNGNNSNTITFNTNVSNFISKAATYDNNNLKAEGSFACAAYEANTPYTFFEPTKVIWDSSDNKWKFAEGQYWKYASALDFFAYMPATKPSYISSISYGTARQPQFVCTNLPMGAGEQDVLKEFVCALTTGRTKDNSASGVSMKFYHPFARLKFVVSGPDVTINSVTLSGLATSGTCTFDGTNSTYIDENGICNFLNSDTSAGIMPTWSSRSGNADLVVNNFDGTTSYLVIPNTYAAGAIGIAVNATWTSLSNITVNKTATNNAELTWQPGYSYTFTLSLSGDILKVEINKFTEQW